MGLDSTAIHTPSTRNIRCRGKACVPTAEPRPPPCPLPAHLSLEAPGGIAPHPKERSKEERTEVIGPIGQPVQRLRPPQGVIQRLDGHQRHCIVDRKTSAHHDDRKVGPALGGGGGRAPGVARLITDAGLITSLREGSWGERQASQQASSQVVRRAGVGAPQKANKPLAKCNVLTCCTLNLLSLSTVDFNLLQATGLAVASHSSTYYKLRQRQQKGSKHVHT